MQLHFSTELQIARMGIAEVDAAGNILLAGYTSAPLDGDRNAGGPVGWDAFIMSFASSGRPLWTSQRRSSSDDFVYAMQAGHV